MNIRNYASNVISQKLSAVMRSLGGCPPWAVLHDMIDAADSDRNGEVNFAYSIQF